jgi:hypothetical protein
MAAVVPSYKGFRYPVEVISPVAEPDQFALHASISPGGVLDGHANHEFLDRFYRWGTSGLAACGVVPFPRDQPTVPGQDSGGSDQEDLCPTVTWHESGQGGQPHPVDGPVAHPGDLSAQHGVLVPQDQ